MTSTLTKNLTGIAFVATFFAMLLALPQASQAQNIKGRVISNNTISLIEAFSSSTKSVTTKDLSCVQDAVLDRETTITTAWTIFNTEMMTALIKRSDALVAAWKLTDTKERGAALKTLWLNWKTDSKKSHDTLKKARKTAWDTFKKTMKEDCKDTRLPKEDAEPKAASGTVTL